MRIDRGNSARELTLTASPAQPYAAPTYGEALHLLDGAFSIGLTNKLYETTMFSNGDLDLVRIVSVQE